MKTFKIRRWVDGSIIHTYTSENPTIKDAVEDAVKKGINLSYANLRSADLSSANLRSADLSSANLRSADLSSAVKLPMYCRWSHGITNGNLIHIGCEKKSIEEWDKFFESDDVIQTKRNTSEFKKIQAVYEAYKTYLNFLNK